MEMDIMSILLIAVGFLVIAIMVLIIVYFGMSSAQKRKDQKGEQEIKRKTSEEKEKKASSQEYSKQSIFNFMDFEHIEDNMIIQKKGKRFLMVVECQGINYDLMSGIEKTSVESGFQQFLNTLRHPIQIYVQTRTINLENSLQTYKQRLADIKLELDRKEIQYKQMIAAGNYSDEEINKQKIEALRLKNLYEYGQDIVLYTEKMSLNRSVLRKQYYIIIPYYSSEAGNELLDKEEVKNLAFSELYTRAQSISRVLSACSISSRVLDSYDLADLLYSSYNRDESEVYGLERALRAGYDELYSTAPEVLDKKMREIDKVIEERAYELAQETVSQARHEKEQKIQRKERTLEELIKDMAISIIEENEQYIGDEVARLAKEKVKVEKTKEGVEDDGKKEQKVSRRAVRQ